MSSLVNHIRALVTDGEQAGRAETRVFEQWSTITKIDTLSQEYDTPEVTQEWESVVSVIRGSTHSQSEASKLLEKILSMPNLKDTLQHLSFLLGSGQSDDAISSEIVEIVGFEEIDLAMELLSHRTAIAQEMQRHLSMPSGSASAMDMSDTGAKKRMQEAFERNAAKPLFSGVAEAAPEVLPHVYTSSSIVQGNVLSHFGSKYMLPIGTERRYEEDFEEVIVPPAKTVPPRENERLVPVEELDDLAKGSFPGYSSLNRIQSIVYPTVYGTNENMLVCAPTGAGKTDVAMLSILRVLDQHRLSPADKAQTGPVIDKSSFKVIYVAPMKALASEIVRKLGKRLKWLKIEVRELTGDMQLTKAEIAATQIIVTTPEKWDVVTRKPTGEGELASSLKLLIIDEVHLLNEERGAVIETIVARTLRQVESSQSVIRIVGLSATLPNYMDVAEFLSVSKYKGLFYFDSSFRPVPLEQHFIGIKGKPGTTQSRRNLDRVTFDKVVELVRQGHQVMVFVHARKETVKSALALKESATIEGSLDEFSCQDHPQFALFRREIGESRNKEMKLLFDHGFGIHHAGMLRSDRNMMERMFEARAIKVLCCTATLAWGVNLPAHAVIIKGTQVYDSSKGSFVDLSVLDVLQVFGRAGRPGLESSGEGYICTTEDKLTHYLDAVTSQNPIESQFRSGMIDALNAEIALGTVSNTRDAMQWLGYTYLFVRMRRNPFVYGIEYDAVADDPQLVSKRYELVTLAARRLAEARMITFDENTGNFNITDLGRIAAKYYIRRASIEIFNEKFKPQMTEADVLTMLSMSTEFDQIQVRESEIEELKRIMEVIPCQVKDGTDTSAGKVNILLQSYISQILLDDFALVSDAAYVAQNGGRIVRALLEIGVSRKWANASAVLMGISKAIEKRMWPFDHPLKQFELKGDVFYGLQQWANEYEIPDLATMSAAELGKLVHLNERHGQAILTAAKQFPTARITYDLRPLGADVLRVAVHVKPAFIWSQKIHGSTEPFWIWIEDSEGLTILQNTYITFRPNTEVIHLDFVVAIPTNQLPPFFTISLISDRWIGCEEAVEISLEDLKMPVFTDCHTPVLDLPFLMPASIGDSVLVTLINDRIQHFNATQTQTVWSLLKTNLHGLVCAPAGSGNTIMLEILVCLTTIRVPGKAILVVYPKKGAATAAVSELRPICQALGVSIQQPMGPDIFRSVNTSCIRVVTARHLMDAFAQRRTGPIKDFCLIACDNLEQLDPEYELCISLLRHATQSYPTRFVGFSSSLQDPSDLAEWLNVHPSALHNFRPRDRDQSLKVVCQTFSIPHSASLFKAMAKPAYMACMNVAESESSIVFVPSKGQCRVIGMDLITQVTLQDVTGRGYRPHAFTDQYIEDRLFRLTDPSLADFISRGVGFFHEGISRSDRTLMLELFAEGAIRVLIVPRDSCWTLPVRAAVVVVMGTQYVRMEEAGVERQLRDYSLTELVRMQSRAVRHNGTGTFHLFCQLEAKDTVLRFLNDGLPLESALSETEILRDWYFGRRKKGELSTKDQLVGALSFTYLARRAASNPVYYDFASDSSNQNLSRIADTLEDCWTSMQSNQGVVE